MSNTLYLTRPQPGDMMQVVMRTHVYYSLRNDHHDPVDELDRNELVMVLASGNYAFVVVMTTRCRVGYARFERLKTVCRS